MWLLPSRDRALGCPPRRWLLGALGVAAPILVADCAFMEHEVHFLPRAASVTLRRSAQKRIAVVFLQTAVKRQYQGTTGGLHHWYFQNARSYLEDTLRLTLQRSVRQVEVFGGQTAGGFDGYLYPKLEADMKLGALGPKCVVKVTLALQDAQGHVRAKQSHSAEDSFFYRKDADADECCSKVINAAMNAVAATVLTRIDEL